MVQNCMFSSGYLQTHTWIIYIIAIYGSNILTWTELIEFAANSFFLVGKERKVLLVIAAIGLRLSHYRLNWSVNERV